MHRINGLLSATAILAAIGAGPALAQATSTQSVSGLKLTGNLPIQIESDKLEVLDQNKKAIFTGNVNVVQGKTQLKSGRMIVFYINDEAAPADGAAAPAAASETPAASTSSIDHIEVDDKVYIRSDDQVATGDHGTFDMATEVMVLTGKEVVMTQGPNVLVGCKLTVQMKSGRAQVDGCGGGRVQMSITPGSGAPGAPKP